MVRRVNGLDPDLGLIAGDLLDGYLPAEAQLQAAGRAPLGVCAVTGNHDPDISGKRFQDFLRAAGAGFFGLPVRIGTDSEVVVFHLEEPQKATGCHS